MQKIERVITEDLETGGAGAAFAAFVMDPTDPTGAVKRPAFELASGDALYFR